MKKLFAIALFTIVGVSAAVAAPRHMRWGHHPHMHCHHGGGHCGGGHRGMHR